MNKEEWEEKEEGKGKSEKLGEAGPGRRGNGRGFRVFRGVKNTSP